MFTTAYAKAAVVATALIAVSASLGAPVKWR